MKTKFHFFTLIVLSVFIGCSYLPDELKIAEKLMNTRPDSALYVLQHIHKSQLHSDRSKAMYGLLLFQAYNKNYMDMKPVSMIDSSINYFQRKNDRPHLALSLFYKARMHFYAGQYEPAAILYLKSLDANPDKNNDWLLCKIYSDMGDICKAQNDQGKARDKYNLAVYYFEKQGFHADAAYRTLDVGSTYDNEGEFNAAMKYYRKAMLICSDSNVRGMVNQQIGISYINRKMPDSAMFYLKVSLRYPHVEINYAYRCQLLADILFDTGQKDSSYYYALKGLNSFNNIRIRKSCYRILANIATERGDIPALRKFIAGYQTSTDSIRRLDSQSKASVIEELHDSKNTEESAKKKGWILLGMVVVVLIISGLVIVWFRKRHKQETEQLEQEHKKQHIHIQKDIILKQRDALLKKIEDAKLKHSEHRKRLTLPGRDELDLKIYDETLHFSDNALLFKLINETLNDVVDRLMEKYPDITPKELIWCGLFLLNVPSNDILLLLNYRPDSISKLKQRLSHKLGLENASKLTAFLNEFLVEE